MVDVDIAAKGPSWAQGCFECKYGVIAPGTTEIFSTLALTRLAAFLEGTLELCSCQAGQRYRVYLLNLNQRMIEEARTSKNMAWTPGSHPEIESARRHLRSLQ